MLSGMMYLKHDYKLDGFFDYGAMEIPIYYKKYRTIFLNFINWSSAMDMNALGLK